MPGSFSIKPIVLAEHIVLAPGSACAPAGAKTIRSAGAAAKLMMMTKRANVGSTNQILEKQ